MPFKGRFRHLEKALTETAKSVKTCYRILEVGTGTGVKAVSMIRFLLDMGISQISYIGFDLFSDANKKLPSANDVKNWITSKTQSLSQKVDIQLVAGDSRETLDKCASGLAGLNLVFLNGSMDPATIRQDWQNLALKVAPDGIIVLDWFFRDSSFGCRSLVEDMAAGDAAPSPGSRYSLEVSEEADPVFEGGDEVRLVTAVASTSLVPTRQLAASGAHSK